MILKKTPRIWCLGDSWKRNVSSFTIDILAIQYMYDYHSHVYYVRCSDAPVNRYIPIIHAVNRYILIIHAMTCAGLASFSFQLKYKAT